MRNPTFLYFYRMELSFSLGEIDQVSRRIREEAGDAKVFAFHGAMGVGKTTLIRSLCKVIGVKDPVSSPTFALINEYGYTAQDGKPGHLYHMDLYRVKNEEEAVRAGIEDCLYSGAICFVEWPEHAAALFPPATISLFISEAGNQKRKIRIVKTT